MSVDTYWDESYYPGIGVRGDPPTITSPTDGATVDPVHDVTGTAGPYQFVTLWSAIGDDPLAVHSTVRADADGNYVFAGEQPTGRDGDVATFVARTIDGSSPEVHVTVAGPVLNTVDPDTAASGVAGTFTLGGLRLDTVAMQVRLTDGQGGVQRVDPDTVAADAITFTATFPAAGTYGVELAEADGGPSLTMRLDIDVSSPVAPVVIDTPETGDEVTLPLTISGTAEPGDDVKVTLGDSGSAYEVDTVTADASTGAWSTTVDAWPSGLDTTGQVAVNANDFTQAAQGDIASVTVQVTVAVESQDVRQAYDPGQHTVAEVQAYLAEHPEDTDAVLAAEAEGKNRAGLVGS